MSTQASTPDPDPSPTPGGGENNRKTGVLSGCATFAQLFFETITPCRLEERRWVSEHRLNVRIEFHENHSG